MPNRRFTVIKGGVDTPSPQKLQFLSAYATDTRLMGVVSMSAHWLSRSDVDQTEDFYQFFYYDAEEYGLETYKSITGNDENALAKVEQAIIGGLGGAKVPLSEEEFCCLVRQFAATNEAICAPLPEPRQEYAFILQERETLDKEQREALNRRLCTELHSEYHAINYFLMRCLAKDKEGMGFLSAPDLNTDDLAVFRTATLCKNIVEDHHDEKGNKFYLCEALIEHHNKYQLLTLELTVDKRKITSVCKHSSFSISTPEAAMMLNRPEFITIFEILTDPDDFDDLFSSISIGTMQTAHNNGRLFLKFNQNNDHVNCQVFLLNKDVYGLYYVSDSGQLFLAAYGEVEIAGLEGTIIKNSLDPYLFPVARYEFKEPILYDFIQSNFEDFDDYLDTIRT